MTDAAFLFIVFICYFWILRKKKRCCDNNLIRYFFYKFFLKKNLSTRVPKNINTHLSFEFEFYVESISNLTFSHHWTCRIQISELSLKTKHWKNIWNIEMKWKKKTELKIKQFVWELKGREDHSHVNFKLIQIKFADCRLFSIQIFLYFLFIFYKI